MTQAKLSMICPVCNRQLVVGRGLVGSTRPCPGCRQLIQIPQNLPVKKPFSVAIPLPVHPVVVPPVQASETLPVEVHLPGNMGSIKTEISKETSEKTALIATGGSLVAIGVALTMWILTGGRRTS